MNIFIDTTVEREDGEVDVRCEFEAFAACRGRRDSCCGVAGAGPALEPDEPAHVEFIVAKDINGNEVELTEAELDRVTVEACEREGDSYEDYYPERDIPDFED